MRDKAKWTLYVDCDSVTLYGAVLQTTNLEYNGHQIEVDFIEPRALVRFLVDNCPPFGPYLLQRLHGGHGNVMTYMDGSKPGNPLRPDDGRAFEAAYWMFHEWPEHLRRQAKCWFTFMYIRVADLRKTGCPTGVVAKFIIREFWLESELHLLGFHVVVAGRQHRIVIKFGGHMGDDKDVYEWGSCNGASSNKIAHVV